jgi:hypothetical protein
VTELHQVLAIEKGTKTRAYRALTDAHHLLQNTSKLSGVSRTYRAKDEDGDRLPSESTRLQVRTEDVLSSVRAGLTELFDVTLTKDVANQEAVGDIYVDGQAIAHGVPVSYLLFLEKQLVDLTTFIDKLPVLDPGEDWVYDATADAYTTSVETTRTKKVPRNHVKAEATDKHQAQVDVYFEDVVVGYWTTTKLSGALAQKDVNGLRARVVELSNAVKTARETANSFSVTKQEIGTKLFNFLLGDQ